MSARRLDPASSKLTKAGPDTAQSGRARPGMAGSDCSPQPPAATSAPADEAPCAATSRALRRGTPPPCLPRRRRPPAADPRTQYVDTASKRRGAARSCGACLHSPTGQPARLPPRPPPSANPAPPTHAAREITVRPTAQRAARRPLAAQSTARQPPPPYPFRPPHPTLRSGIAQCDRHSRTPMRPHHNAVPSVPRRTTRTGRTITRLADQVRSQFLHHRRVQASQYSTLC